MSNNPFLQIHNKFELKLFDQKGQLLQEGFAYNVANSKRYVYEHIRGQAFISGFWNVEFGVGDVQNNPPTDHDYTLRNRIFSYNLPLFSRITPFSEDYQTIEFQSNEMSFPANRDYVGKLTEIGLADHYHNLYSHAAFVDVENHPIIIDKTENNILKVKVIIYFTPIISNKNKDIGFYLFPAYATTIGGSNTPGFSYSLTYGNGVGPFPQATGGIKFYFSPMYTPEKYDDVRYMNALPSAEPYQMTASSVLYNGSANNGDATNCFPITFTANNVLFTQADYNFGFAHSIIFPSYGAISLPNETIIPAYKTQVEIGTGDGEKTYFFTSVNEVKLGADNKPLVTISFINSETEETIVVDPSEYEFINFDTKKSPLWNKMIYIEDAKTKQKIEKNSYFIDSTSSTRENKPTNYYCRIGSCALTNFSFALPNITSSAADIEKIGYAPNYRYSPVYYDANGITLDEAKIGTQYTFDYKDYPNAYSSSCYGNNYTLKLFYKDIEEEEWSNEKSITIDRTDNDYNNFIVNKFTPITAKFWKLQREDWNANGAYPSGYVDVLSLQGSNRFGKGYMGNGYNAAKAAIYGLDPNYIIVGNSSEYDFSKVGLTFKNPPPAGTIIMMEATLNLPYKTPEGSMTFSYQATVNDPTL